MYIHYGLFQTEFVTNKISECLIKKKPLFHLLHGLFVLVKYVPKCKHFLKYIVYFISGFPRGLSGEDSAC